MNKPITVDTFLSQIREYLRGRRDTLTHSVKYIQDYQAELVERMEAKVRQLTKTAERNAYLNQQNQHIIAILQRRQRLLEGAARVGHSITSILDLDRLLSATVDIICEEYGFYYAGIFLLTSNQDWAVLRAGFGEAGIAMITEGHRLAVDDKSMVGAAIRERKARISRDVDQEQARFKNPHLAQTRSEMALPLIYKDQVLGALTVQSDELNAFSDDDVTALQALADQVAIAIQNAQLLQDLEAANNELLRTKTFEAIATATGEAIHWVGNKAAPIPSSARRVRDDLLDLLAIYQTLIKIPAEEREDHPLWAAYQANLDTVEALNIDLESRISQLAAMNPRQLLIMGGLDSVLEDLDIIQKSANTILSIKEDLIGPVRLSQPEEIHLAEFFDEIVFDMGLPTGVMHTEVSPDTPPVRSDKRQLANVFNNLIKNAWEALNGHSAPHIWVSAQLSEEEGFVLTQVRDNGPGIPPELLDRIWVSFFTTKGDRGGTGLGLFSCMEIVHQAGGKIWAESLPGEGATFSILLPAG
jgi:signal transduction histidine kinase